MWLSAPGTRRAMARGLAAMFLAGTLLHLLTTFIAGVAVARLALAWSLSLAALAAAALVVRLQDRVTRRMTHLLMMLGVGMLVGASWSAADTVHVWALSFFWVLVAVVAGSQLGRRAALTYVIGGVLAALMGQTVLNNDTVMMAVMAMGTAAFVVWHVGLFDVHSLRFEAIVRHTTGFVLAVRADGRIHDASHGVATMLGRAPAETWNVTLHALLHPADQPSVDAAIAGVRTPTGSTQTVRCRWLRRDGRPIMTETVIQHLADRHGSGVVLVVRDISDRIGFEEQLREQASRDMLTGLVNRAELERRTAQAVLDARITGEPFALVLLDVDRFKSINDNHGHHVGDAVLAELSRRLMGNVRATDVVGRLGGDEFAILLGPAADGDTVERIVERVTAAARVPFDASGVRLAVTMSAGVTRSTTSGGSVDAMLRDADAAMYVAKRGGRARHAVFTQEIKVVRDRRVRLNAALQHATARGEFTVVYQPTVDLHDEGVVGVEALLRWTHPELGEVSPDEFVPLAEDSGAIVGIGNWVLRHACRQAADWRRSLATDARFSLQVNVSPRQLAADGFCENVRESLASSGLAPGDLVLELTETALFGDLARTRTRLQELKALGVRLAIDDFGTGYSSLAHVRSLPVDQLKIDRSFVRGLEEPSAEAVILAVLGLARSLDLTVVAEGIETRSQARALAGFGCAHGQGLYFAGALSADATTGLLRRHGADGSTRVRSSGPAAAVTAGMRS